MEMKCHYCGGQLEKGKTEYNSPLGITIRGVPALVCANCGKAYITGQVAEILDKNRRLYRGKTKRGHSNHSPN